jgi:hypothetical protein
MLFRPTDGGGDECIVNCELEVDVAEPAVAQCHVSVTVFGLQGHDSMQCARWGRMFWRNIVPLLYDCECMLLLSRVECLEATASVVSVCISPFPATVVCDTLSFLTISKLFWTVT